MILFSSSCIWNGLAWSCFFCHCQMQIILRDWGTCSFEFWSLFKNRLLSRGVKSAGWTWHIFQCKEPTENVAKSEEAQTRWEVLGKLPLYSTRTNLIFSPSSQLGPIALCFTKTAFNTAVLNKTPMPEPVLSKKWIFFCSFNLKNSNQVRILQLSC